MVGVPSGDLWFAGFPALCVSFLREEILFPGGTSTAVFEIQLNLTSQSPWTI